MTKNIDVQKVNEELKSLDKAPAFTGSDFDHAVIGEILKNEMAAELRILQAFEMGRRSKIREERAENKEENTMAEMKKNQPMENFKKLAIDLDDELNAMNCDIIAIKDITTLIGQLRINADNVRIEDIRAYFTEFHRMVRILDELSRFATSNLIKNWEAAEEVQKEIYENAYNQDDKKSQFALQSERPVI